MPANRYPDWESFRFPGGQAGAGPGSEPVAFCADLSPASVLGACRRGIVPIPAASEFFRTINEVKYEDQVAAGTIPIIGGEREDPYWAAWWSPDPRPLIDRDGVHLGRNVRKRLRRDGLVTTADTAFRNAAWTFGFWRGLASFQYAARVSASWPVAGFAAMDAMMGGA